MNREQIKALALQHGFTLRENDDLRPYVYEFAEALIAATLDELRAQQEPSMWMDEDGMDFVAEVHRKLAGGFPKDCEWFPLYLYPPPPTLASDVASDAEFLAKRLGRVAKLAGVSMPEMSDEGIAEVAGTILGEIAGRLESRAAVAPSAPGLSSSVGAGFSDTSTADPITKARRVLDSLMKPDDRYFFHDGYPRNEMKQDAKAVRVVMDAILATPPSIPDGWQMVPKEPTPEMVWPGKVAGALRGVDDTVNTYRAMLAAAPKPEGE